MVLALAGDTMLGRGVAERLAKGDELFSDAVHALVRRADLFVLNLECCISDRGRRWPDPDKPFFFRAPPVAVEVLAGLGVDCVTLANNHALDFDTPALLDTLHQLRGAGIGVVGAGVDLAAARAPARVSTGAGDVVVIAVTDHPKEFAAGESEPGVAYANLRKGVPDWLLDSIRGPDADVVIVAPHWGPNMVAEPVHHVKRAAEAFRRSGATLVAGHSAHVVHGAHDSVLFDLGDFVDDYAVDPIMRNDLGMFFLVTIESGRPTLLEAVPLKLEYCFTRLADGTDAEQIGGRFLESSLAMGSDASESDGRIFVRFV
jgi:poly-gamma-glutamate capsule biosynthesis protein CapA/YwtB (metallophosphatase superfamily)